MPMRSISSSTTSPGFSHSGGVRPIPTPSGVPVKMTSPGCRVRPADSSAMIRATGKTMCFVLESCFTAPFTRVASRSTCGSGISSFVTIHGPSGRWVSKFVPLNHWPPGQGPPGAALDELHHLDGVAQRQHGVTLDHACERAFTLIERAELHVGILTRFEG